MPLINVVPDFLNLVKAVNRLADGVEALLLAQWGIDMAAPKQDRAADGADAGVDYATDERTAAQEAEAELRRLGYKAPEETEE